MNIQFAQGFGLGALTVVLIVIYFFRRWKKKETDSFKNHESYMHVIENTKDFLYYCQVYPELQFKYLGPSAECFFGEGFLMQMPIPTQALPSGIFTRRIWIFCKKRCRDRWISIKRSFSAGRIKTAITGGLKSMRLPYMRMACWLLFKGWCGILMREKSWRRH